MLAGVRPGSGLSARQRGKNVFGGYPRVSAEIFARGRPPAGVVPLGAWVAACCSVPESLACLLTVCPSAGRRSGTAPLGVRVVARCLVRRWRSSAVRLEAAAYLVGAKPPGRRRRHSTLSTPRHGASTLSASFTRCRASPFIGCLPLGAPCSVRALRRAVRCLEPQARLVAVVRPDGRSESEQQVRLVVLPLGVSVDRVLLGASMAVRRLGNRCFWSRRNSVRSWRCAVRCLDRSSGVQCGVGSCTRDGADGRAGDRNEKHRPPLGDHLVVDVDAHDGVGPETGSRSPSGP